MKKLKYYIETSVFNFPFVGEQYDLSKKEATIQFFEHWPNLDGEMYISELVEREIARAPQDLRNQMMQQIQKLNPIILNGDEDSENLADRFIQEGLIPVKYRNDALHIAIAVVNEIDIVVSWNLEHMVKLKTRKGVNAISTLVGYRTVEIVTPEEVL